MPALPRNPSSMTKERLVEELRRNNISLPSGRSKKEVFVELYKRHLLDNSTTAQLTAYRNMSVNTSPKIGFSSDEEDEIEVPKVRKAALNANNNRSQVSYLGFGDTFWPFCRTIDVEVECVLILF